MNMATIQRSVSLALLATLWATGCVAPPQQKNFNAELPAGAPALIRLEDDRAWPDLHEGWLNRAELIPALERSIGWTAKNHAKQFFPIEGISNEKAQASLERFRDLLSTCQSAEEFEAAMHREFALYKSAGWDGQGGGVLFTAYFTPILDGREAASAEYRYPLYGLPDDLQKGAHGEILGRSTAEGIEPYPARHTIEASGILSNRGLELAWFASPLDAFIAHVNGSAFIRLEDGSMLRLGYAGNNGKEYTSLAKELVAAGELPEGGSNLNAIRNWADANPAQVESFLQRNERFVFFTPISGNPRGSLNLEVEGGRSLATDKALFPRGALVFVDTHTPGATLTEGPRFQQFMLDQDTGGAIRTAGRADIYLGIGDQAGADSGRMKAEGQLYYLFLD
ncbi:MAG: membrane-bound lytic murein transglycosylase A [Planctomycetota bacterium]|jgi:membrane-bound lytic murein transglycosylase A